MSIVAVRDTTRFLRNAAPSSRAHVDPSHGLDPESARRTMFGVCQAGLVNNLNDGISWGVLPLLFAAHGLLVNDIGVITAVYPLTWSIGQLATGALADRAGRRPLIISGMIVQALALGVIGADMPTSYFSGIGGAVLLGLGTATVYPALLAAAAEISPAARRATTLGWYRFWRDLGYPAGALLAGIVSAQFGLVWAVYLAGTLTFASGVIAAWSMTGPRRQKAVDDAERARMRVGAPRRA